MSDAAGTRGPLPQKLGIKPGHRGATSALLTGSA